VQGGVHPSSGLGLILLILFLLGRI